MADNNASPGPGWTQTASGDWQPPTDNEIPYTFRSISDPSLLPPDGTGRMPGHKRAFDPQVVAAQAAAAYAAERAAADAKAAATLRADTAPYRGATPRFTPAPRRAARKGK